MTCIYVIGIRVPALEKYNFGKVFIYRATLKVSNNEATAAKPGGNEKHVRSCKKIWTLITGASKDKN